MKILHFVLTGKWYDMIAGGENTEEYRALTPYWCNRLIQRYGIDYWKEECDTYQKDKLSKEYIAQWKEELKFEVYNHYDAVCFHRGYTNTTMSFEYETLDEDKGKEEWGAPSEPVFIIKLGKRL